MLLIPLPQTEHQNPEENGITPSAYFGNSGLEMSFRCTEYTI